MDDVNNKIIGSKGYGKGSNNKGEVCFRTIVTKLFS